MTFVEERIPEPYWGMLKELNLYDEYTYLKTWTADYEREIYLWIIMYPNRDDYTTDYILLWGKNIVVLNTEVVQHFSEPERLPDTGELKKGLIKKKINKLILPSYLSNRQSEVIEILKEVFQHSDRFYITEFISISGVEIKN